MQNKTLKNYERIIDSSTYNFSKRHLISDRKIRLNLLEKCNLILVERDKCEYDASINDPLSIALTKACASFAYERIELIATRGDFDNGFDNVHESHSLSDTHTMIVSENLLLHIL